MSLETNLRGRLKNTDLPLSHGLLPLFEAVINSIHAIEDLGLPLDEGRIYVEICRAEEQFVLEGTGLFDPTAITSFKIRDNGIGFNEANMTSFRTLDSEHKAERGGRGVGRLLWLKAFRKVEVISLFNDESGNLKKRSFSFDALNGLKGDEELEDVKNEKEPLTSVNLVDFVEKYRKATYKTADTIANSLLEHCLWYFVRSTGVPKIVVIDNQKLIDLGQLYQEYIISSSSTESISIKDEHFNLTHTKLRVSSNRSHSIGLCADNRLVKEEKLSGKVPGLHGKIGEGEDEFIYICYVRSNFLDRRVRSERTGFDISEKSEVLFKDQEISLSDIRDVVIDSASKYLDKYLDINRKKSEERINEFVAQQAPRYRPILPRMKERNITIDPSISDKELELFLHKELSSLEAQMLSDGHDLMRPEVEERFDDYKERLQQYLQTADEIKKSDLANYVFHRKVILDLLAKAVKRQTDGKYSREELVHTLLMPMQVESNEVKTIDANLWLIDERLAFHDYLASDKPLSSMSITGSGSGKEPDILALNVFDNPLLVSEGMQLPLASIVVIEIKRPMRNDAKQGEEKDPVEQALGYLDRIREGKVSTSTGRAIPNSENVPGFCYILCDITPTIKKRCEIHDAIRTSDGMGYFFYHKIYSAYVEILSFDRLVNSARERNRAFFDKLGLPTT